MTPDLTISEVQQISFEQFNDPQVVRFVMGGGAGGSKMLSLDTPIPTPDGWKLNGDLSDGDVIYAPDGSETTILKVHPIKVGNSYRVYFDDGTFIDADADHLWSTFTYRERKNAVRRTEKAREARRTKRNKTHKEFLQGKNTLDAPNGYGTPRTTLEILSTLHARGGSHNNHAVLNTLPINATDKPLIVDPYTLGAWLGDGTTTTGEISGIDDGIFSKIELNGLCVGRKPEYQKATIYGLRVLLREIGVLGNKHIPQNYLRASVSQRIELLRGLMDTDGTIGKQGKTSFTNTNTLIIDGICELLASLGIKYSVTQSDSNKQIKETYKTAYTVFFVAPFIVFNLQRKANRQNLSKYRESNRYRYIVNIEKIDNVQMRCITVDHESSMYLCGKQMVPTHNTMTLGLLAAIACKQYPGTRWGLARKELKALKQTTLVTLLSRVHKVLGIGEDDYKLNLLDSTLEYTNGSQILLLDLTLKPSDPEMESLGSLELTGCFIDEVGEVNKKAYDVLGSRVNRWMNKEYGITGKIVSSMNPSANFIRQDFYDKYEALGGGRMQRWQNGHVYVNDVEMPAYDVYIKSTAFDNPWLDKNYIEGLKRLPPQERKRLLDGDWNYLDEDNSLFTMSLIDKMTVFSVPENNEKKFSSYLGIDPADAGKDMTVVTLVEQGVITKQLEIKSPTMKDAAIGFYIAGRVIQFAEKHGFNKLLAKNITIEGNGIGASSRDALRTLGWNINVYTATLQTRNEGYYQFMIDADAGRIKILNTVIEDGVLLRQLAAHRYDLDTGKPVVTRKKDIKKIINRSPDNADSAMIANMAANKFKPKNISSYIRW
jgi:intein/homing endonuclease